MKKKYKSYLLYFLILVYVSGSIGFVVNPSFFSPFTPYTLLFTCAVYLIHRPLANQKFIGAFLCIAFLGFIVEIIGVKTGVIFGTADDRKLVYSNNNLIACTLSYTISCC